MRHDGAPGHDIQPTEEVLVDPKPDERGNVMAMALIGTGQAMIALSLQCQLASSKRLR